MTPQERQLVDQLFDRLAQLEREPRDAEAERAIRDGLMRAPNAVYALVQTALVQDEALRRADARIEELQAELEDNQYPSGQAEGGGFLERMRNTMFGGGSVPSVRTAGAPDSRGAWSSGGRPMGGAPGYAEGPLGGGGYGGPGAGPGGGFGGGGFGGGGFGGGGLGGGGLGGGAGSGSFLGTAAAAAAGTIGGSLLLNSIRGMMGPAQAGSSTTPQSAADSSTSGTSTPSPWGTNTAADDLSRQAGVNDIGRGGKQDAAADDNSQSAYDNAAGGYSQDDDDYDYAEDDDDDFDMA